MAIFCLRENSAAIQRRAWDWGHLHLTSVPTHATRGSTESFNRPVPRFPPFRKPSAVPSAAPLFVLPCNPSGAAAAPRRGDRQHPACRNETLGRPAAAGRGVPTRGMAVPSPGARAGLPSFHYLALQFAFPLLKMRGCLNAPIWEGAQ